MTRLELKLVRRRNFFFHPPPTPTYIYFLFKLIRGLVSVNVIVSNQDLTRSNRSSFSSSTQRLRNYYSVQLDDRLATRSSGNASTIRKIYSGRFILNRYPISALPRIFNRGPHPSSLIISSRNRIASSLLVS